MIFSIIEKQGSFRLSYSKSAIDRFEEAYVVFQATYIRAAENFID
jgi:putative heme iron utilization protein